MPHRLMRWINGWPLYKLVPRSVRNLRKRNRKTRWKRWQIKMLRLLTRRLRLQNWPMRRSRHCWQVKRYRSKPSRNSNTTRSCFTKVPKGITQRIKRQWYISTLAVRFSGCNKKSSKEEFWRDILINISIYFQLYHILTIIKSVHLQFAAFQQVQLLLIFCSHLIVPFLFVKHH